MASGATPRAAMFSAIGDEPAFQRPAESASISRYGEVAPPSPFTVRHNGTSARKRRFLASRSSTDPSRPSTVRRSRVSPSKATAWAALP